MTRSSKLDSGGAAEGLRAWGDDDEAQENTVSSIVTTTSSRTAPIGGGARLFTARLREDANVVGVATPRATKIGKGVREVRDSTGIRKGQRRAAGKGYGGWNQRSTVATMRGCGDEILRPLTSWSDSYQR